MLRLQRCIFVICLTVVSLTTTSSLANASKLVYENWNRSACQFTQYSRFELTETSTVASVVVWYHWQAEETRTPFSVITSNQDVIFSGMLSRGQCDPFQRQWCHAEANVGETLTDGTYAIKVPKVQVCQNQESQGQGFVRLYAGSGPSSGSPTSTLAKPSDEGLVEILDPAEQGDRARGHETWVRKKNADGSFYMWVTGGRELQSVFMPRGSPGTGAWTRSSIFPGFVVNNQGYIKKLASMPAEKTGTVELLDPASKDNPAHASETWVRLTNHDGSFHLWITEGRQLHCLHKPEGSAGTSGWNSSSAFNGYVVKCNRYKPINMQATKKAGAPAAADLLSKKEAEAEALRNSGVKYYYGRGVRKDYKKALELFTKAGNAGNAAAQRSRGIMLAHGQGAPKNISEAIKWLLKAARQGDAAAQNRMGNFYKDGNGVAQDYHQARAWFQKAAAQDNTSSQFYLGVFYNYGYGVEQNKKTAVEWYRKAARLGDMDGQANLGNALLNGEGVPRNPGKAVAWLRLAAEQGQSKAQSNLGFCYTKGIGLTASLPEALRWFRKCAAKGNESCIKNAKILQNAGVKPATGPLPPPTIPKTVLLTPQTKPVPGRAVKPLPGKGAKSASPTPTTGTGSPKTVADNKPAPVSKSPPATGPTVEPQPGSPRPKQPITTPVSTDPAASTGGFPGFTFKGTNKFGYKEFTHQETWMVFVLIPKGPFVMGTDSFGPFSPEHEVYIDDYLISKYEVTQGVWEKYMGEISTSWGYKKGDTFPVEHVSWKQHNEFVQKVGLFLPTEAEWEKAVRAGTRTKFYWGDDYEGLDKNSWHEDNSGKSTHPVGQKEPNGYGLYDMVGNVAEWCQDIHANSSTYYVNSPRKNPLGPNAGSEGTGRSKVHRGGSYREGFRDYWSAGRDWGDPNGNGTAGSRPVFRLYKGD